MTRPADNTAGDPVVHLVRAGRYPHVIARGFNDVIRQHTDLAQVSCGICLAAAGDFLADAAP